MIINELFTKSIPWEYRDNREDWRAIGSEEISARSRSRDPGRFLITKQQGTRT